MRCLCRDCKNKKWLEKDSALVHLLTKGMYQDYARLERWHLHNEPRELPPSPRNDTDSQGLSDAVFHGGAEYHGLLSSLNPMDEGSSIPMDEGSGIPLDKDSGIPIRDDPAESSDFPINENPNDASFPETDDFRQK